VEVAVVEQAVVLKSVIASLRENCAALGAQALQARGAE
jgi:hypothetical protein